jgi:hypothetical protein
MTRRIVVVMSLVVLAVGGAPRGTAIAATLQPETLTAWDAHVAATERRIAGELESGRGFLTTDFQADGLRIRRTIAGGGVPVSKVRDVNRTIDVPGGLISHWRGSVLLPGVTLDSLLSRLRHPSEQGPHQEDVLSLRVLDRRPDQLTLFIRMTRTKIVTVTYDTEHKVEYRRDAPTRVSSRSVATKIVEIDGAGTNHEIAKPQGHDRGFLWRMNSYWRYEEVANGVIVELESLTLSRSIPLGLGVVVQPIVDSVAKESMTRTLDSLRHSYARRAVAMADVQR